MSTNSEELLHYGVKGMKWGVRKSREERKRDRAARKKEKTGRKQAKRDEKSAKYKAKAAQYQKEISDLNAIRPKNAWDRASRQRKKDKLHEKRQRALEDAERKSEGKLSKGQKKALIGGATVAALVAASVAYSTVQSGEGNRLMMNAKEFLGKEGGKFKKNDSLKGDFTPEALMRAVVEPINPDYAEAGFGAKMNCRRCTFSYEMRRRGYDVEATKSSTAFGQTIYGMINATDPEQKPHKSSGSISSVARILIDKARGEKGQTSRAIKMVNGGDLMQGETRIFGKGGSGDATDKAVQVFNALSKQPPGSRGELGLIWGHGGGHSIAYEILKSGKPVIIDTQSGTLFENATDFLDMSSMARSVDFTRLDNKPLDTEFLKRWSKNAS